MNPVSPAQPVWASIRPWRNSNPGDLRVLRGSQMWDGQMDIDWEPGGPFAIFSSRVMGWRALAVCLLAYLNMHKLDTIAGIIGRYAPPDDDNDTNHYADLVATVMDTSTGAILNLHDEGIMGKLCGAIALMEGGARIPWDPAERALGVNMALTGQP